MKILHTQLNRRIRLLGVAILVVISAGGYFLWASFPHLSAILSGSSLNAVCGCANAFSWSNQPWLNGTMLVLMIVSIAVLTRVIALPLWQLLKTRRFVRSLHKIAQYVFIHASKRYTIFLVDTPGDMLFTVGVFFPKIIMSAYTHNRLSLQEHHAALLHEIGHIRARHIIERLLLHGVLRKKLRARLELEQEIDADRFALHHTQRHHVLSALTTFCDSTQRSGYAISSFSSAEQRLRFLLGEKTHPPLSGLRIMTLILVVMATLFLLFSHSVEWAKADSANATAPNQCLQQHKQAEELLMSIDTTSQAACVAVVQSEGVETVNMLPLTDAMQSTMLHK